MKLSEWNELVSFAEWSVVKYTDIFVKSYTVYDGRKGLTFQLFDSNNKLFAKVSTGVLDSDMEHNKARIENTAQRAIEMR